METHFTIDPARGRLTATWSGPYVLEGLLNLISSTMNTAAESGCGEVLIDVTGVTGGTPTAIDRFEIGSAVADHNEFGIRAAAFGHLPMIDPQRFAQVVATNRGARLMVCTDRREALAWLDTSTVA